MQIAVLSVCVSVIILKALCHGLTPSIRQLAVGVPGWSRARGPATLDEWLVPAVGGAMGGFHASSLSGLFAYHQTTTAQGDVL